MLAGGQAKWLKADLGKFVQVLAMINRPLGYKLEENSDKVMNKLILKAK